MFSSSHQTATVPEPTDADAKMVEVLIDRFSSMQSILENLPSIEKMLTLVIRDDLINGKSAMGLSELIHPELSRQAHYSTPEQLIIRMAIASLKQRHTRKGRLKPGLLEERNAMLSIESERKWDDLTRMVLNASRRHC